MISLIIKNLERFITAIKTVWSEYGEYASVPPIFMATYSTSMFDETVKLLFAIATAAISTVVIMWTKFHYGKHLNRPRKNGKTDDKKL